jgi:superfamily II DNA helicase RecQ
MSDSDKPHCIKSIHTPYKIDYQKIFSLETIILQLIKNNYILDSSVGVRYDGDPNELKYALRIINDYTALFCRLVGIAPCPPLKLINSVTPVNITLTERKGIYIINSAKPCKAREIWYGQKLNYRLSESNLCDLEYLLSEISPFGSFKEGQFYLLKSMLGADGNSICIMPAGIDKSLIFYMVSLLQPIPVIVVAPSDTLIRDQIRNLRTIHRIDNASHIRLLSDNDYSEFEMWNNMIYLTPSAFQNKNMLLRIKHIDEDMHVSYIILDEIHCLFNRDHDFIPEYLMFSKFLGTFLNQATLIGFTATADYTVIEEVRKQLSIPEENIFIQ